MKTIIQIILVCILFYLVKTTYAQDSKIHRTLNIEIFVEHNYDASKKQLMEIVDSTNAEISFLKEMQMDRGTKKYILNLFANNSDFETIENCFNKLGYVKTKELRSQEGAVYSVANLTAKLNTLKLKQKQYKVELSTLSKTNPNYFEFWHELISIEQQISETEELIDLVAYDRILCNLISIVLY